MPLFSAGCRFSLDQTSWESCHGGIKRDNRKPVRGSTSGLSRFRAPHNIPRDGQQVGCLLQWSTFLVTCPLPGRKKKKKKRGRASQSITCHCLSLDGWMMDDCIFSNNTKTLPMWETFCTGKNCVCVCVCGQLTSPFFPPQLTADIVPLHAGYDTWLEGQSVLLNTLGVWEKSKKSKGTTVFCECFHSVFLP